MLVPWEQQDWSSMSFLGINNDNDSRSLERPFFASIRVLRFYPYCASGAYCVMPEVVLVQFLNDFIVNTATAGWIPECN